MLPGLVSNLCALAKDFWGPSVVDGHLNHARLALATRCYWIQSRIFHIPDRLGFISAGPPRLQVDEIHLLVYLAIAASLTAVFCVGIAALLVSLKPGNESVKFFAASLILLPIQVLGEFWLDVIFSSRRDPGYVWEDWKVQTE
ncbi:hypothetical protein QBC39DRAFT_363133 [Podospora conica]|nr:hypothetical protein QBC39DRAFT_363133 [Schizothecium conicum]